MSADSGMLSQMSSASWIRSVTDSLLKSNSMFLMPAVSPSEVCARKRVRTHGTAQNQNYQRGDNHASFQPDKQSHWHSASNLLVACHRVAAAERSADKLRAPTATVSFI